MRSIAGSFMPIRRRPPGGLHWKKPRGELLALGCAGTKLAAGMIAISRSLEQTGAELRV
jgi:hypothetical protein